MKIQKPIYYMLLKLVPIYRIVKITYIVFPILPVYIIIQFCMMAKTPR